jgi:hypothetical protein
MKSLTVVLAIIWFGASPDIARPALDVHIVPLGQPVAEAIVGRSVCAGLTWLLTQRRQLIAIEIDRKRMTTKPVAGFRPQEDPWGLACLSDGSLWTLATARTLVRIRSGAVTNRISLPSPRFLLYASGDRLLYAEMPIAIGRPLLSTGRATPPFAQRPWAGLVTRRAASRVVELSKNLAGCGIGIDALIPCWFVEDDRISISNGATETTRSFAIVRARGVDPIHPIRDVALAGRERVWVLARSTRGIAGTQPGGRLIATDRSAAENRAIDLEPAARFILAATESTCWLLTTDGKLMEVSVP